MHGVRAILLAAGSSSRFGSNKLLHPLNGVPIAVRSARNLAAALAHPLAVVKPGAHELTAALRDAGCETVVCDEANEGMGLSLACGVRASADAGGWLVALADMPFIRPRTMADLAQRIVAGGTVVAPLYQGRRGHPVCFSPRLRGELVSLQGDEGARKVFQRHAGSAALVEVDDPGVLRDIDTPGDLISA
jgi:molybdenum cofactor cytidylyltransferase